MENLLFSSTATGELIAPISTIEHLYNNFEDGAFRVCEEFAEVQVYRKVLDVERPHINSSAKSYNVLHDYFIRSLETYESFVVMYMDAGNNVNCVHEHFKGGIGATVVDIRLIAATALLTLSTSVIISHNHPSGGLIPSSEDKNITTKIKEALKLFDIKLLDHIILTRDDYFSFADEGII